MHALSEWRNGKEKKEEGGVVEESRWMGTPNEKGGGEKGRD